jgi:nucleotide-binding universal stress UspA family protein
MTSNFKIMAAVDMSDLSGAIVHYTVWLSMKLNAETVLVNVVNQRDLDTVQRAMSGYELFSFPNYLSGQVQDRKTRMKDLFEKASPGMIKCNYLVKTGLPYLELLAAIESEKPQLMVVGTKGRSNLADVVIGSTARKLFRRSPIPLLTIPAGFDQIP